MDTAPPPPAAPGTEKGNGNSNGGTTETATTIGQRLAEAAVKGTAREWEAYGRAAVKVHGTEAVERRLLASSADPLVCWPREFDGEMRRFVAAEARARFDARLLAIRRGGLTRAEPILRKGDPAEARRPATDESRYVVRWSEGRLIIHSEVRLADGRWHDLGHGGKVTVLDEAGLAEWRFRPEEARLFE